MIQVRMLGMAIAVRTAKTVKVIIASSKVKPAADLAPRISIRRSAWSKLWCNSETLQGPAAS